MTSKNIHHRENRKLEATRLNRDLIEQRALQIARDEGRDAISQDDRERAETELFAPNEVAEAPEVSPEMNPQVSPWDAAPASPGKRAPKVRPEDEASIGKELTEKGLRGPRRLQDGQDPLERQ